MNIYHNQMIFTSILHLSIRGIQEKYQLPLIRWPTWSLALVANFNTPSQLGRTPSANPSARLYYLCHHCPALLYSALLNHEEEELIENVSYHSLLTQSQFHLKRVSHHSYWPEISFVDPGSISQESVSNHWYWSQISFIDPKSMKVILA